MTIIVTGDFMRANIDGTITLLEAARGHYASRQVA
jgi:dTDP-D-glucose 4,6-dehydratase